MTIAVGQTGTYTRLPCNGVTVAFNFPNKIFASSDLVVNLIDTLGVLYPFVAQANIGLGLSYTVANVDNDTGCSITMSSAPTNGWSIDLRTLVPEIQTTSIKNQGQFLPELHEEFFDRATRMLQDLYRLGYQFGIHGPDIETTVWPALPAAASRKGQSLIFDGSTGLPTVGTPVSSVLSPGQYRFVGTDSGAANAYVVTVTGTLPVTLVVGALATFTALNGNTGASTANIGATGAQPVVSQLGIALTGGEILTSEPTWVQWTGAAWQIIGTGAQPSNVRTGAEITAAVTPVNYVLYAPGNVLRYGTNTVPGTTDMTTAIQNALNSNSQIFIPDGIYKITSTLILNDYNWLFFQSRNAMIKGALTTALIAGKNNTTQRRFFQRIDSGTIDNTSTANAGGIGIDNLSTSMMKVYGTQIQNVETGVRNGGATSLGSFYNDYFGVDIITVVNGYLSGTLGNENKVFGGRINSCTTGTSDDNNSNNSYYGLAVEVFTTAHKVSPTLASLNIGFYHSRCENAPTSGAAFSIGVLAQDTRVEQPYIAGVTSSGLPAIGAQPTGVRTTIMASERFAESGGYTRRRTDVITVNQAVALLATVTARQDLFNIAGLAVGDSITVDLPSTWPNGLLMCGMIVVAGGVYLQLYNPTGAGISVAAANFVFNVVKYT